MYIFGPLAFMTSDISEVWEGSHALALTDEIGKNTEMGGLIHQNSPPPNYVFVPVSTAPSTTPK